MTGLNELVTLLNQIKISIEQADPEVLICTLWMADNLMKGATVVDALDHAIAAVEALAVPPAWTPFERASLEPVTEDKIDGIHKAFPHLSRAQVEAQYREVENDIIWINSRYQVNVRVTNALVSGWPGVAHLSIKRIDKDRVGPERYRDFMRIKDELVGPDYDAIELYPKRSREVDTANQYHLWVFMDKDLTFPVGWDMGRNVTSESLGGARQHPLED